MLKPGDPSGVEVYPPSGPVRPRASAPRAPVGSAPPSTSQRVWSNQGTMRTPRPYFQRRVRQLPEPPERTFTACPAALRHNPCWLPPKIKNTLRTHRHSIFARSTRATRGQGQGQQRPHTRHEPRGHEHEAGGEGPPRRGEGKRCGGVGAVGT